MSSQAISAMGSHSLLYECLGLGRETDFLYPHHLRFPIPAHSFSWFSTVNFSAMGIVRDFRLSSHSLLSSRGEDIPRIRSKYSEIA